MVTLAIAVALAPLVIAIYAYVGYPLALLAVTRFRKQKGVVTGMQRWPTLTITIPVYNAVDKIRTTLERILELDYPSDKVQILVISDASTDGTDDVVREYEARGVELLRHSRRIGKTAGENAAVSLARGELIVNIDATILVPPTALKPLIEVFVDPTIGVASGRDVSVGDARESSTTAETRYTDYEMWIRDLETRAGSIVGASGCFYAIRREIHGDPLPDSLSWDFASPLVARMKGYRSVSVPAAVCVVPRTAAIRTETRRKVRTMARGLRTLFYLRSALNPARYGGFALMLMSHKLFRWLPYLLAPFSYLALCFLALDFLSVRIILAFVSAMLLAGVVGLFSDETDLLAPFALPGFAVAVFSAGFMAWWAAFRNRQVATWEPTPRAEVPT